MDIRLTFGLCFDSGRFGWCYIFFVTVIHNLSAACFRVRLVVQDYGLWRAYVSFLWQRSPALSDLRLDYNFKQYEGHQYTYKVTRPSFREQGTSLPLF